MQKTSVAVPRTIVRRQRSLLTRLSIALWRLGADAVRALCFDDDVRCGTIIVAILPFMVGSPILGFSIQTGHATGATIGAILIAPLALLATLFLGVWFIDHIRKRMPDA